MSDQAKKVEYSRAWHITVYDLMGGPVPLQVIDDLETLAQRLAKEYQLAIETSVE